MDDKLHISLGGNIELKGFQNVENSRLIVLKKIIGNYARQMKEKRNDYKKLVINLEEDENNVNIKAELIIGNNSIKGEESQGNIFIATDNALKKVMERI